METNILNQISQKAGIAPELIIREYWEMVLLQELANSSINQSLVFKGGTALRLGYQSPRFSEDLDFDLNKKISMSSFKKTVEAIAEKYPEIKIKDLAEKYYTLIVQFDITDNSLARAFSIKIKISKRQTRKKEYYEPKILTSETTSIQIFINVIKLEKIKEEKMRALKARKQARDLFDLWYIAQLNKEPWNVPKHQIKKVAIKQELNKFLPKNYQLIINELI